MNLPAFHYHEDGCLNPGIWERFTAKKQRSGSHERYEGHLAGNDHRRQQDRLRRGARIIEWSAKNPALLTDSRKLAIDRFYACEQMFTKHFYG